MRAPCLGHALDVIGAGIGHHETDRCRAGYRSLPVSVRLRLHQRGGCGQRSDMARGDA